jgi:hypothetical protein
MRLQWRKLGHIFNPHEHSLPVGGEGYAQSPQALVLDDRVRIYFSTRQSETNTSMFLSHVSFVDFDLDMTRIIDHAREPVISLGELGAFDEHGIFPFSPLKDNDRILAYTCGWNRRVGVAVDTATGLVESHDRGKTFARLGPGPVFAASLHEPFLVGDSFVRMYNGTYYMWYIYGTKWVKESDNAPPDRVYKIAQATSQNGIDWIRNGHLIIEDKLHDNECQALPTVIEDRGMYHMFFCYRDVFGFRHDPKRSYRLGYARSYDLKKWTRDDKMGGITISSEGWDSDMQCYPHIFRVKDRIYLLYNGNKFGRDGFGAALLEGYES